MWTPSRGHKRSVILTLRDRQLLKVESDQIGHGLLKDFGSDQVWTGAKENGGEYYWLDGNVRRAYTSF